MNEELRTVNQENRHKVEELGQLSSDLQNFLGATDIATLFLDRELRILRFTPRIEELFNVCLTDRGRPISNFTHRLGYDHLPDDAQRVLVQLVPVQREVQDEAERWYLTRVLPYRSTEDRIDGVVITFVDITERKRAEERSRLLAEITSQLLGSNQPRQVVETICRRVMVHLDCQVFCNFLLDEEQHGLQLNADAGVPEEIMQQNEWPDHEVAVFGDAATDRGRVVAEHIQATSDPHTQLLRSLGIQAYACHPLRIHDLTIGTLSFGSRVKPTFTDDKLELMRTVADHVAIALQRTSLLQSLERHAQAAEAANEAKNQFLAVLSHELRTPLTPVVVGVSMLQHRADLDPAVQETLETIRCHAEMEVRLIEDLLDVARFAHGKIELQPCRADLCTVLQRAVEVCQADVEARGLQLCLDWGPGAPYWVDADAARLQQVFWNLLKNAVKFTPRGGGVALRCWPEENHVVVEVNDSGIGIEAEALPRLFTTFAQADRSITRQYGGLGLGLSISKTLVEMHGGTIEAHSEGRNRGSTFRVRLPLLLPTGEPEISSSVPPAQQLVRPLHVLLVEDHGITAKMMSMVLTDDGHSAEMAGDVATALALASEARFDLLVSDLDLPDGTGHELMRELRQRGHAFPGIALSGYGQQEDIRQSYEAGFAAHLTKPVTRGEFLSVVASVAASHADGHSA